MKNFSSEIKAGKILPYIMVGEKSIEDSLMQFDYYVKKGCQIIEIGVPFSDPSADGLIIQNASKKALLNQIDLQACLEFTQACKARAPHVKMILMSYLNPIYAYGLENFFSIKSIDGIIIPDLPFEEYDLIKEGLRRSHMSFIPLIALDTPAERIQEIITLGSGFIYLMSVKGITGTKKAQALSISQSIDIIKQVSSLPVVTGFGIKTKAQVKSFLKVTEGVVIASEFLRLWNNGDQKALDHFFTPENTSMDDAVNRHLKSTLWIP